MDAAQALIMGRGLAGTSIDMVLEQAGMTKGAFFYHFKSKNELAKALIHRYAEQDHAHIEAQMTRAEKLSHDPLQQVLIFIGLLQEESEQLVSPEGGCLIASYMYQFDDLEPEVREICAQSVFMLRQRLGEKYTVIIDKYPPRVPVKPAELADALVSAFEGAFILMRVLQDPGQLYEQLAHYRNYIELLFLKSD
jgi:TetR/AcrR family transcriptional repressor of nem operon